MNTILMQPSRWPPTFVLSNLTLELPGLAEAPMLLVYVDQDVEFDSEMDDEDRCAWNGVSCVYSVDVPMLVAGDVHFRILIDDSDSFLPKDRVAARYAAR